MKGRSRLAVSALALVSVAFALPGCARDPQLPLTSPIESGRTAGALTPEQVAAYREDLGQMFARATTGTAQRDGVKAARAAGYATVTVARLGPSGGIETATVDSEEQAVRFLRGSPEGGARAAELE